jgi:hypothetical protein
MRLAAPETVLSILGIQQSPGSLAVAGAALDATFSDLEARTDSLFLVTSRTDYFDLDETEVASPRLRLTSGFVSLTEDLTVRYSADGLSLSAGSGTELTTGYVADYVAGVVWLDGTYLPGKRVVSITYTHGFELSDDDVLLADVPTALEQAHISLAAEYMMLNPANVGKEKAKFMAQVAVHGYSHKASRAVQNLTRPRGTVIWPSFTERHSV